MNKILKLSGLLFAIGILGVSFFYSNDSQKGSSTSSLPIRSLIGKVYPFSQIEPLNTKELKDTSKPNLVIHMSTRCPHCQDLIMYLDKCDTLNTMFNIFPVFKSNQKDLSEFVKNNSISRSVYITHEVMVSQFIRAVPAIFFVNNNNIIKDLRIGVPSDEKELKNVFLKAYDNDFQSKEKHKSETCDQ